MTKRNHPSDNVPEVRAAITTHPTPGDAVRHIDSGAEGVVVERLGRRRVLVQTVPDVTEVWYDANAEII